MPVPITIQLNGQSRTVDGPDSSVTLEHLVAALELKADRIAVELNGVIVRRTVWESTAVLDGDRLEIVHFVGGGC